MLSGRARVLQVLRDGAATSVVAQMESSNAVLKFVVGGWRKSENGKSENSAPASANELKSGHTVLLRLLHCAPPVLTVEVQPVEGAGSPQAGGPGAAAEPARKRPFLRRLA